MERKRAFQMRERFDRAKTPMGAVPISVIMGFDYPLGQETGGRGEASFTPAPASSYVRGHSRGPPGQTQRLNTDYMNTRMLERLPRAQYHGPQSSWPASLTSSSRAVTEVRETVETASARTEHQTSNKYSTGFTSSFAIEHPKQQPCR